MIDSNFCRTEFPDIQRHLNSKPQGVSKDDLLDAAGGGLDCAQAAPE